MPLTERQIELRHNHLTASEAACLCVPDDAWIAPRDLYWSKVRPDLAPKFDKSAFVAGNFLEPAILAWGADELQVTIRRDNAFRVSRDPFDGGILSATIDAYVSECIGKRPFIPEGQKWGMEAKYVSAARAELFGQKYTDEVPKNYLVQCQQQCLCADLDGVFLVALICDYGLELKPYRIYRNDRLIREIQERCVRFWREHIEPRIPPPDSELPPLDMLKSVKRSRKWVRGDAALGTALRRAREQKKEAEAIEKECVAALANAMGTGDDAAGEIDCAEGGYWTYHTIVSKRIDADAVRLGYPEVAAACEKDSISHPMREKKQKKEKN